VNGDYLKRRLAQIGCRILSFKVQVNSSATKQFEFRHYSALKSYWTIRKLDRISIFSEFKSFHEIQPVFRKTLCWISNNMDRRSGPWSRCILFEKVIYDQRIFRKCRKYFQFVPRTLGGHCIRDVLWPLNHVSELIVRVKCSWIMSAEWHCGKGTAIAYVLVSLLIYKSVNPPTHWEYCLSANN